MTTKTETLTSLHADTEKPLTDKSRNQKAYRISREIQNNILAEIIAAPIYFHFCE